MNEGAENLENGIKEKVAVIDSIPTGVHNKANAVLVLLGEKPATEIFMPNKVGADKTLENLLGIGLCAEIVQKPFMVEDGESTYIAVARSTEVLDQLRTAYSNRDHKEYGLLMGYPTSAVEAFSNKDEMLPSDEQDELTRDLPRVISVFRFSKDNKDAELEVVKRNIKLLAEFAPDLFRQISAKHGDDLIKKALSY